MDFAEKKQRRRSVRNLRKSACFVPPSLDYGSAWIGENQDTNISNLVKSLEDLQCQDEPISIHSQIGERDGCDEEDAQDGFQHRKADFVHSISPCSKVATAQSSNQTNNQFYFETPSHSQFSLSSRDSTYPEVLSSEICGGQSCVSKRCEPTDRHIDMDQQNIISCNFSRFDQNRPIHCATSQDKFQHDLAKINGHHGLEKKNVRDNMQCLREDQNMLNVNVSVNSHSPNIGNEMYSESNDIISTVSYEPAKVCQNVNPLRTVTEGSFALQQEEETQDKRETMHHHQILGNKISHCNEVLEGEICDSNSNNHLFSFNTSCESPNNSMSPEFNDSNLCIRNSAGTTPTIDHLNKAMISFLDASPASAFNMSFSPMDLRPGTPTSSFIPTSVQSGYDFSPQKLQKSISHIISSLEDPVVSSDPETSQMFHNSGISFISANLSPSSQDPNSVNPSNDLNTTFTISSTNKHNETEGVNEECEETNPESERIDSTPPADSIDKLDIEQMMIADFDFKKNKCHKRRSSNFTEHPTSLKLHSNTFEDNMSFVTQVICDQESHIISPEKEKAFENSTQCVADIQEMNSTDIIVSENNMQAASPNNINSNNNNNNNNTNEQFVQSTSQPTLKDSGNVLAVQTEVKTRKPRRKSNKLARLIEESERFFPESANQEMEAGLQDGNKENELNMEVEQSMANDQLPSVSKPRTRRGRKSWDLRKDSQTTGNEVSSFAKRNCNLGPIDPVECSTLDLELEDLQLIYNNKQTYEAKSPKPLETVKENATEKTAFSKQRIKRYLKFGYLSESKEKKRMKKALSVYRGRQCYYPVTEQEFERKMLDVQLLLDVDIGFSI